jgi:phosphoribosylformimino-5-aminoimidazole carboxamide ribonucleotide (ProFAR) isomerase
VHDICRRYGDGIVVSVDVTRGQLEEEEDWRVELACSWLR